MATASVERLALAIVLLAAAPLAGCASDQRGVAQEGYQLAGEFTENGTQEDGQALAEELQPYDAQLGFFETEPPQFLVRGFAEEDCGEIRSILDNKTYVASYGECVPIVAEEGGDANGSNDTPGTEAS